MVLLSFPQSAGIDINCRLQPGVLFRTDLSQFHGSPINDTSLKELADAVSMTHTIDVGVLERFRASAGFKRSESSPLKRVTAVLNLILTALDKDNSSTIHRVYVSCVSTRWDTWKDVDLELICFVPDLRESCCEGVLDNVAMRMKQVAADHHIVISGLACFFRVKDFDICLCLTPSEHPHATLQRQAVDDKLYLALTERERSLYSASCSESLDRFMLRFTKMNDATFIFDTVRLIRLWSRLNLSEIRFNSMAFVLIALKAAETHCCETVKPSLTRVFEDILTTLTEHGNIRIYFDTFSASPLKLAEVMSDPPAVIDPTNCFNNVADTISDWRIVESTARISLDNIRTLKTLSSIFPDI